MTSWVLIVMIFGTYVPNTKFQEFYSKETCETAAKTYNTVAISKHKEDTYFAFCSQK